MKMTSIRLHSSLPEDREHLAYLVLTLIDADRVSFDFAGFRGDGQPLEAPVTLSHPALYEILQGHEMTVAGTARTIHLEARGDEFVIHIASEETGATREYHVWLSEVALGWNVLSRRAGSPT
jgi:hypothetical protein